MQEEVFSCVPGTALVEYDNNCLAYFKEEQLDPDSSTYSIDTFPSACKLPWEGEFQDCAAYSDRIFPSATCKLPCQEEYPGPYEFDLQLNAETSMRNRWLYSQKLKKVYVSMLSKLSIQFKWIQKEAGLRVRALLVYCMEDHFKFPVLRCPNHTSPDVPCNIGFQYVDHIVRCDNDRAEYHKDEDSGRLSVVVPLDVPHAGTDWVTVVYSFVCKNSCPVGMNRRATAIIFTLERPNGEVIGRRKMGVRICSCPKRDKEKEERDFLKLPGPGNYLPHYTPVPEYDPTADNPDQSGEVEEPTPSEMDRNADLIVVFNKEFGRNLVEYDSSLILITAHTNGVELSKEDKEVLEINRCFLESSSCKGSKKSKKRKYRSMEQT
ncbi:cellular tumor antigen p53 isoform X2 [Anabrus simplex]|uniref:cellular tumor antigen p53 isoform X2 n=1 Tax=Anabrus simplex TaxID=316456 RepID=UPI0034DD549B